MSTIENKVTSQSNPKTMDQWWSESQLAGTNSSYLESLYESYLQDPASVDPELRSLFSGLADREYSNEATSAEPDLLHSDVQAYFKQLFEQPRRVTVADHSHDSINLEHERKQVRVLQLINAYRFRGHQSARTNPLDEQAPELLPELTLKHHQLSELDLDQTYDTGSLFGPAKATLRDILSILKQTYCGPVGAEYMHIVDTREKRWIQERIEMAHGQFNFDAQTQREILRTVTAAEGMERYLHTKYVGQKRFSLEGGESLIPMLNSLIQNGGDKGAREVIIAMAHRGRLNVLVNIMGKTPGELFAEFEGKSTLPTSGDVKYHMGFSSDVTTPGGTTHLTLAFNPSHLEIVSPVALGSARSRQDRREDNQGRQVLPISIHGDAAFAGQGVVMETFNMSQSRGYSTKGTVHIVVNNQIGFTTSNQKDARSTLYSTDAAKMVNAPIFHVNGDNPEAVVFVTQLALEYRMQFNKDVVIDLVCYRRHGHNEADEPSATQPMMYKNIKARPTTRRLYAQKLIDAGIIAEADEQQMVDDYRDHMDQGDSVQPYLTEPSEEDKRYIVNWQPYMGQDWQSKPVHPTAIALEKLRYLADRMTTVPDGFTLHPRVKKIIDDRQKMAAGSLPIDWGFAETLAYAGLLDQGYPVRLSGQDSGRGTFFHRHAVLHSQQTGKAYIPLRHLHEDQAKFLVIDSLLSEEAVLAFEYGYTTNDPHSMVIWEAQFGDFVNGAQVVIDQFISSGEQKWGRLSGLTMFLPHGYEGQGPEHSSARLERFLQLCAQHNMQVCVPTTPAQAFHMIRRQMLRPWRAPLIVMTPKSLLRHKDAVNSLEDITDGEFQPVLGDTVVEPDKVTRLIMCSGKVYYDLAAKRKADDLEETAIVRIEQLYPFPEHLLRSEIERYPNLERAIWCQEEPKNQGSWFQSQHHMRAVLDKGIHLDYAGRAASASPAVGYAAIHAKQQKQLVEDAFTL